jgi:chaperonin GroES
VLTLVKELSFSKFYLNFCFYYLFRSIIMTVTPLHDRVLVRPSQPESVTAGGIIIPDTAQEKSMRGEVVATGPGKTTEDGKLISLQVKVGDNVLYGKYAGSEISVNGEDLLLMRESDILATISL